MKKYLVLLLILVLGACSPEVEEMPENKSFDFNGIVYEFQGVSSLGYDLYTGDGQLLEVLCEDTCIISFEEAEDIYIIQGDSERYEVSKNGTTIVIDGADLNPTGLELPEWNDDIIHIFELYDK
jgi:hypothetical protein